MPPWYFAPGYLAAILLVVGLIVRQPRTALAAFILFADWMACTIVADRTASETQWAWLAIIDSFAAWAFVAQRRSMEALMSLSLAVEVLMHMAYGILLIIHGERYSAALGHWWGTFAIACGQCLCLAAWGSGHGGRRVRGRGGSSRSGSSGVGFARQSASRPLFPLGRRGGD